MRPSPAMRDASREVSEIESLEEKLNSKFLKRFQGVIRKEKGP
jgi:hypothetical protein